MQFCKLGLSLLFVLLLSAVCTHFSDTKVPTGPPVATLPIGVKDLNVLVIVIDPVLKTRNNQKLHEHMHWSDPYKLTLKLVDDLRVASHGYVNYHVVDMIEYDGFTQFKNGFTYTEKDFLNMWESESTTYRARDKTLFQDSCTCFTLRPEGLSIRLQRRPSRSRDVPTADGSRRRGMPGCGLGISVLPKSLR